MGLSRIFDISRRSLATYQKAMDVTSHNVANASNENYSRQRVSFTAENPEIGANFIWGSGVKIDEVQRVRSTLIDSQLRTAYGNANGNEQQSELLSQIEQVFSEPSELGISNMMTQFFNSWNELAVSPNSMALRYNVLQKSQQLTDRIQVVYDNLNTVSYDSMRNFTDKVNSVNTILKQIKELNVQVVNSSIIGVSASDVMDQRDALIDDLSKLVNINVIYDQKGSANISIGGLQSVDTAGYIEFETKEVNGTLTMVAKESGTNVKLTSGKLYGLSQVYSEKIPEYLSTIDAIANSIMDNVNNIHKSGYSLEDPPLTGTDFFESYSEGHLVINSTILNDATRLAVSADGSQGNGQIAADIAKLTNQKILNGITLNENFSRIVAKLGSDKQNADQLSESTNLIIEQLQVQKGAESGVSIDEEMTNIIRFQRSYDASARLIKIADQMLETLINMV